MHVLYHLRSTFEMINFAGRQSQFAISMSVISAFNFCGPNDWPLDTRSGWQTRCNIFIGVGSDKSWQNLWWVFCADDCWERRKLYIKTPPGPGEREANNGLTEGQSCQAVKWCTASRPLDVDNLTYETIIAFAGWPHFDIRINGRLWSLKNNFTPEV